MRFHLKKTSINLAKYETIARADDAFCPFTQAWLVNCSFSCPITLSNYKHDAYTVLLVLKSGWWWPIAFEYFVIVLITLEIEFIHQNSQWIQSEWFHEFFESLLIGLIDLD